MIEVQLITSVNDNKGWLQLCINGLNSKAINIHQGSAVPNNVTAARMAVWDSCGGDLLSSADPDDVPLPGAWQKLQDAMDANPKAMGAYTLECKINALGGVVGYQANTSGKDPVTSPLVAHHILVVRRVLYEAVKPFATQYPVGIEWLLATAAFHSGGLICVPEVGYKWRRHIDASLNQSAHTFVHNKDMASKMLTWLKNQPPITVPMVSS